ncbi:MAG: DNA repair protein, partial [Bacteroidota bacterium]
MTLQIPSQISEIELRFNYTNDPSTLMEIRSSSDAFKAVLTTWNDDTIELIEECKLLILNRANR